MSFQIRAPRPGAVLLRGGLIAALIAAPLQGVRADDAAPAIEPVIDQLLQVDPAALVGRIAALKAEADQAGQEAVSLRGKADAMDQQVAGLQQRLDTLTAQVKALGMTLGTAEPAAVAMAAAPAEAMAAEKPAEAANLTNYQDHVLPILKARCASCHNPDKRKSGLAVTSFALLKEGGSSGEVFAPGDPDGSRIIRLITHAEEPYMPPSGDPLTPEQIETIRKWIADGALPDAKAAPMAKNEAPAAEPEGTYVAATFADTPPMPEVALAVASPLSGRGVVARAVDANPRSPLMAVGGNREVLLYNLENFTLLGALPFPEGDIFTLSFSVSGELLAVAGGEEGATGLCVVYNVRTAQRVGTYGEYYDTVLAADISPDQRMIALGGPNKKVRVYAMDGGAELYTLESHTDWIYAVKFTPDGEVLATADRSGGLFLWQAANGRPVEQLRGHEGAIHALAYTPDSAVLASAGQDGTIQLWDTWTYTRIRSIKAHAAPVLTLDIGDNNQIVSCGADKTTRIWNLEGKEERKIEGLPDWGYQSTFANGSSLVAVGTWDGVITLWNTASGEKVAAVDTNPAKPSQG